MKISKIAKSTFLVFAAASFFSCVEEKIVESVETPAVEEAAPEPAVLEEKAPVEEKKPEPVKPVEKAPEPEPKKTEVIQIPKTEPVNKKAADEYSRSVGAVDVSKDDFEKDKKAILQIIDELSVVMKNRNYKAWLSYIDAESIEYWQKPANLKKAQNRLPVKGLSIRNLEDYFKFVFIPARTGRVISEIRYDSNTYVKAVQVEEGEDIVYYFFNKINGKWMLHLPPLAK